MVSAIINRDFGLGLVTGGMTAYLMSMCNKRFTATQFALLSSLMGPIRTYSSRRRRDCKISRLAGLFSADSGDGDSAAATPPLYRALSREFRSAPRPHTGETFRP